MSSPEDRVKPASRQLIPELANVCVPMAACPRPTPLAEAAHACSNLQPVSSAASAAAVHGASQGHCEYAAVPTLSAPEQAAAASGYHRQQPEQEQHEVADQLNGSCGVSDDEDEDDQNDMAVLDHCSRDVDQDQNLNQLPDKGTNRDHQDDEGMDDDRSIAADDTAAVGDQVDGADPEGDAAEELPNHICMVDGCDVDLSGMKPYFRRSKICPAHQAAASVLVSNQECRFCQQCTRCHPVDDFDGMKRSCRSQLLHHNKSRKHRRRCTPGSFYSSKRVRSSNGVAKKKAPVAATTKAATATNRPGAATKSAGAAAAAIKTARSAAAVQPAVVKTAEAMPTWQRGACSKPGPAAAISSSRSAAKWKLAGAAAGTNSAAAAAAMPGYDPCRSTSGSRSRFADKMSYEYNIAAAGAARQGYIQHHGLTQQYSADTIGAAAAPGPMGSQHLLQGFKSLPNPLNPGYMCPPVIAQGLESGLRSRALPPQAWSLGYSNSNPDGYPGSHPGATAQYPRFQGSAAQGNIQSPYMVQNPSMLQAPHEPPYDTRPMAVPGSRNASMTGVMTAQGLAKTEDDLNPSCSSCSSKGSPHMPAAATAAAGGAAAAVFSEGRSVTTMQPQQQQQPWQQQQQMTWQHQTWMQPLDDIPWQQQQQQGAQSTLPAAAAAANMSTGCRKDLYRAFESVGLPQQSQQQQREQRHLLQPTDASVYDAGHIYKAWGGIQQQEHQQQQQYQQQQQHMSCSDFAAMLPQQQHQQFLSRGTSGRLQLARQLARQVAAAAATAGAAAAAGAVHTGVRAMLDPRHQQQQQFMQSDFAPQQYQQQQQAAVMLLQQQHSSPDVSAGSTCAPGAPKPSPQEVHGQSFAPGGASTATTPLGYTVAPYTVGQQQQRAAPQQQQEGYGLAPADVVVGIDFYPKGFANPSWATPSGTQASLAENPSSNPSDGTHVAGFDRQSSMTSHSAGPLPMPAAVKHNMQQVTGSNPLVCKTLAPGFNSLNPHLMGLDVPALAALVGGCLDSDLEDAWLLDACRSSDDKGGDPLMETLGELGF